MTQVLTRSALDRAPDSVSSRFAALHRRISEYREYRKTVAELRALDTRELEDLGIARFDITRIAREAVYGA